jgi:hypothetical protein
VLGALTAGLGVIDLRSLSDISAPRDQESTIQVDVVFAESWDPKRVRETDPKDKQPHSVLIDRPFAGYNSPNMFSHP